MMTRGLRRSVTGAKDSPAGLARGACASGFCAVGVRRRFRKHRQRETDVLDNITLYWLRTPNLGARLYWENGARGQVIVAASRRPPRSHSGGHHGLPGGRLSASGDVGAARYRNLIYFTKVDRGGHFGRVGTAELFSAELRAAFRSLR